MNTYFTKRLDQLETVGKRMHEWWKKIKLKKQQTGVNMDNDYELQCIPRLKFLYNISITTRERNAIIAEYFDLLSNNKIEEADDYLDGVKKEFDLSVQPDDEPNFAKDLFDKIMKGNL